MTILRAFLYLVCIVSIGWSVLVFGGPLLIKRFISVYSDGALIPFGVTVSPRLDVSISRLEFDFQNELSGRHIEGFSRATKIEWSLFGEKPFLELKIGPSVVKDYATAKRVKLYTPSFQKIDWQNVALSANIETLNLNSYSKMNFINLAGNISLESTKISNLNIYVEKFTATNGSSNFSANSVTGEIKELDLKVPVSKQLFSSTFAVKNIILSEPNLTFPEAMIEILVDEKARKFNINLHDLQLAEYRGFIANLKADGSFNHSNVLQELHLTSADNMLSNKLPKFPEVTARIKRSGGEKYQAYIEGNLEEFELSASDNFIGLLPSGDFVIDLWIDRAVSKVTSKSKIKFHTFSETDIVGNVEVDFSSEPLTNLGCAFRECKLSDFNLSYKINFDDEWVQGRANCPNIFCRIAEMDHLVRTSDTNNFFKILNQTNILNPLSSLYLFGAISSGKKINKGHEIKFQF